MNSVHGEQQYMCVEPWKDLKVTKEIRPLASTLVRGIYGSAGLNGHNKN